MLVRKIIGGILIVGILAAALTAGLSYNPVQSAANEPARFNSYEELVDYIGNSTKTAEQFNMLFGLRGAMPEVMVDMDGTIGSGGNMMKMENTVAQDSARSMQESSAAPGYSGTNNQVQGVDEADLVKTDGNYLYVISGNELFIIKAHPANRTVATLKFAGQPTEAFINGDTLVVFGNGPDPQTMFLNKYNIADRSKPVLIQENTCDGYYVNSRMIGENIYAVINTPVYRQGVNDSATKVTLPRITTNDQVRTVPATEIHFFPNPDYSYQYTTVLTLKTGEKSSLPVTKTYLTGTSQNLYVSQNNIYLTGPKTPDFTLFTGKLLDGLASVVPDKIAEELRAVRSSSQDYAQQLQQAETIIDSYLNQLDYGPALELEEKIAALRDKWHRDIAREQQKTAIFKLAIKDGQVEYRCQGEVDGRVLNQFSMDEHNGYFRIATTSEGFWFNGPSNPKNNIYVLNENLKVVGKLLGLAPTERIYSARFMGDRAYLVTFRQVDPLFVIDMKEPAAPKVLGELKIPGFSNYLHPYDENLLIGIGKEVSVASEPTSNSIRPMIMPPPTRQQGVKIALFDVSNPAAPKEVAKYVVDRDDSDSPALRDHRAVLFSKDKNLLVIPISYMPQYRIMIDQPGREIAPADQGWQGAFVFEISPEKGIRLQGKVEHPATMDTTKDYYEFNSVKRSLYIEDKLYTISDRAVKVNDLNTLRQIKQINLR
ncbi:MAG: hypothetical protein JL56_11185 [Desulfotomaculum sp. BICA1-6]|nr:MAG: hypothetical protein JL56_11185 [Desulfotomaculum sp. BICA1-6]